jgi:hypothetical protein
MRISINAVAIALVAALPCVAHAQLSACRPPDFTAEKLSRNVTANSTHIKGQLVNKCPQAAGARIKVTIYDKSNSPLLVQDLWPAGIKNIPAKSSFAFESVIPGVYPAQKFDVQVLEAKFWPVR